MPVARESLRPIMTGTIRLLKDVMPDVLIAAIARTRDEAQLEKVLLQSSELEMQHLALFTGDRLRAAHPRARLHFIPLQGSPVTSGTNGTNVPGLDTTLALSAYLVDAGSDHLKDMGISGDAADYYNIAIDEGRSVVTYAAMAENAESIEQHFRACGLVKIRRFALTKRPEAKLSL